MSAPALAAVDTATMAILLRANVPVVLLDARSERDDDGKRIPGAVRLPAGSTAYQVQQAVGRKGRLVVTYSGSLPCPASLKLYRHLRNLGYDNVLDYPDGLAGWQAAGYPVERTDGDD